MKELIMAYQGEMALKGLNRKTFEVAAMKTIRKRLSGLGNFKVYNAQSTIYVEPQDDGIDMDEVYRRMQKVFGIAALSRAAVCEKEFDRICAVAKEYLAEELGRAKTFKVVARRSDKTFPMTSMELASELGGVLLDAFPHLTVDVHHPDCQVFVEVRDYAAYVHPDKVKGAGGLPTSTSGKASVLLSGGIDSPVAAWMMAKRGLTIQGVHFASPPYTSERAKQKVVDLAYQLMPWCGPFKLFVVPFTEPQVYIRDHGVPVLFTVLMRRSMMRVAEKLSVKYGADALITGESLAQVASQTLKAIVCTDAAQELPVLRPLIGMDKSEITEIARKIDTYEISIQPFEDCCTIFTPPHPKTKPSLEEILAAEAAMPELAALEEAAAENAEKIHIE
ncbi:MAG TPA: tRNA 4-thiouridine(8) synthase ThiI [Candidatus Pygmaiobacter gallistercoris]|nr:tRNA 4-thiouridine(8) synthase ThiI [Candidatus Pygmaiobacter gallistercoris]